jgi:protoheme IX farnesyltransferase
VTAEAPLQSRAGPDVAGAPLATQSVAALLLAFVGLMKPRIIELLLVTTVPVMFLAAGGVPELWTVLATVVGGTLSAGSANALNCVVDADIDQRMRRTRSRPLPRHRVSRRAALLFGIGLGVLSTGLLGLTVNWLSAGLALGANVFYVVVYTLLLKPRTPQNIVWGGAAGCFPVLIGWTAVRGDLSWAPVVLFLVVFLWTPPHFWSLAIRYRDDYSAAGVPMLPSVATTDTVCRHILTYSYVMVAVSLLLWPVAGTGWLYPAAALALGSGFIVEALLLRRRAQVSDTLAVLKPMQLFHASNLYLTLLFVAVAIDSFVH